MAKIPTAADIAQVTPGSLPRINVPTGAFGERTAQAMEKLGGTITDIGLDMKKRADEADAKDLDAQFDARLRLIEFGDGTDQNPGYYSRLGKSAIDQHDASKTAIDQALEEIKGKAGSAASRRLFEKSAAARMKSTLNKMSSHRATQFGEYEKGASIARQSSAVESAIANSQNEVEYKKHMGVVRKEAHDRARKQFGNDPEIIKREVNRAASEANVKIINDLMDRPQGAALAEKFFKDNIGAFDPSVRQDLANKIRTLGRLEKAQTFADNYFGDPSNPLTYRDITKPEELAKAIGKARKQFSGEDEKAVVAELKTRAATAFTIKARKDQDLRLSAIQKGEKGQWSSITAEEKAAMMATPGGLSFFQQGPQLQAARAAGRLDLPDTAFVGKLTKMNDSELASIDLTSAENVKKLGKEHKYWTTQQRAARQRVEAGSDVGRTPTQIRAAAAKGLGDKNAATFGARFDEELEALTAGKPKGYKPPSTEVQKIADRLTLQMRKEMAWYQLDEDGTMFKLTRAQGKEYAVDDVEENYDNLARIYGIKIESAKNLLAQLKKIGKPATLANIKNAVEAARRNSQ